MKIFDAHSHYMPPRVAENTMFFKQFWSDLNRQLSVMDQLGIEKALLLYPTSDAHLNMGGWREVCREYNGAIADVVNKYPDRFVGAGILPVDAPESIDEELRRIKDSGLSALTLASSYDGKYLDDEMFAPVYSFACENKMPIHVHPQIMSPIGEERVKDPLLTPVLEYVFDVSMCIGKMMMEGTFSEYPEVDFIFAHYGGVLPFVRERFDNTYQMLRKRDFVKDLGKLPGGFFKNLYFDTSGSKSAASLLCALEVVDADHILFGSDFPANQNIEKTIEVISSSALIAEYKEQILERNFIELMSG
ncbi:MAG: amidohydrolase [Candidatus Omnitrophica bacterium]|nr:amidohydrolase [Candidatus Omnitrophota bacterium]